ncbi:MAG: hypothetical protein ACHBN1_18155 [Heteroscytonema crispum UTEX LB 1556]
MGGWGARGPHGVGLGGNGEMGGRVWETSKTCKVARLGEILESNAQGTRLRLLSRSKKGAGATMPYAQCPMPNTLCPKNRIPIGDRRALGN